MDNFEPEDIIVVDRKDNATVFNRLDSENLAHWLEDYSLGEIWEKNVIGGQPLNWVGMKRVVFIVEGDTEVSFIQKRVIPYLYSKGFTNPMNAQKILTNRKLNKKGGNVGFEYLKNDVSRVAATKTC